MGFRAAKAAAEEKLQEARHWVADNRGISSQLAARLGKSPQFIGMVLRGKRKSALVEQALKDIGAPIKDAGTETRRRRK